MINRTSLVAVLGVSIAVVAMFFVCGCATPPLSDNGRANLVDESTMALNEMKNTDPGLAGFLRTAYGYAVFPDVGKGGFIAGGAHGIGVVYERGTLIGFSELSQVTVGGQIGGQSFSELIVFEDKFALQRFNSGQVSWAAGASAVALNEGVATAAKYTNGVAVFAHPIGGLMAEAVVGGQQFTFTPK